MSLFNGVNKCKGPYFRAEKEKLNEKLKEGDWQEEVDDSGFYAGELTCAVQQVACLLLPLTVPVSRWTRPTGGRDHRHGQPASERDQSCRP